MKRSKTSTVTRIASAILTSDLHLTESTPVSRTDDYQAAQQRCLQFLQELSHRHNGCPVLCSGDVFDHWKASPWLCSFAFWYLPRPFICIPGQHDLPNHSLQHLGKSALGLLGAVAEDIHILQSPPEGSTVFRLQSATLQVVGVPFGMFRVSTKYPCAKHMSVQPARKILMLHELTWLVDAPHWNQRGLVAEDLLNTFDDFDLIITGDNHQSFVRQKGNTLLVNPGSMMQMTADQENYQPQCYLYYADDNTVEAVNLPTEEGTFNREHLDAKKERDERIAAYIERMNTDWEIGLSFRKNLEAFFNENDVPKKVREIVWRAMEATN